MALKSGKREAQGDTVAKPKLVFPQRFAFSRGGMVATAHHCATNAGREILEDGGNAIDAAVAAAFALGVCQPAASRLGGQTMMLIHDADNRRNVALDGSSRAPNRATPGRLATEEYRDGWRATTVPSTPATLDYARQTFGTLPLARLLEPAIRLAKEGFVVTDLLHRLTKSKAKQLRAGPAGPLFLRNGERAWPVGSTFQHPVLARTLQRLARHVIEYFYT